MMLRILVIAALAAALAGCAILEDAPPLWQHLAERAP